jgi:hypothetical protein
MLRTLLKGQALSYFEHLLRKILDAEDSEIPNNDLLELVNRDIGLEYILKRAICVQKYYMRRGLYMGCNNSVQQFVERLNDLNRYLHLFSEESPKQLDQDEIIEILDQAKAPGWHEAIVGASIHIFEMSYEESVAYFKRLAQEIWIVAFFSLLNFQMSILILSGNMVYHLHSDEIMKNLK